MTSYKLTLLTTLASLFLLFACGRGASLQPSPTSTPSVRPYYDGLPGMRIEMSISESVYGIYFYPPLAVDRECVESRIEHYRQSKDGITIRRLFLDGGATKGLIFVGISPKETGEKYKGEVLDEIETCKELPAESSVATNQPI